MLTPTRPLMTIKGQVYEILKKNICDGSLKPGCWLQEKELAKAFEVSRSPVREALKQLVDEGLAVEFPNKGVFVKDFSAEDIDEIYDMRIMLEGYAIRRAGAHMTLEKAGRLRELIQGLKKEHAAGDLAAYIELDTQLHQYIVSLCGNRLLEETYHRIYTPIRRFRAYSLTSKQRFDDSIREHSEVVAGLIQGNLKEAERINQEHLTLAKEEIIRYVASLGEKR